MNCSSRIGVVFKAFAVNNSSRQFNITKRCLATVSNATTTNTPSTSEAANSLSSVPLSPELSSLVDRICSLDLLQTAQLVSHLKKRLNLPDVIPQAMAMAATPQTTAQAPSTPVVEKTEFKITLEKFDPASKAKVIKEIKALLPQLNLVEAKNFVESAPKTIKEKVKKEEAEKIKKTLEDLGATIVLD